MLRKLLPFLVIVLTMGSLDACAAVHPELKAFPAAEAGMERFVIVLPEKTRDEEGSFKVELIPGKVMLTDSVNQMRHATSIEALPLVGWGYTYYQVVGQDLAMSTMMAVPEGVPQAKQFVPGSSLLIDYNSRLPIVVYAPKGFEIRYRIWSTSETTEQAEQG